MNKENNPITAAIKAALRETEREGTEQLINQMEDIGFFTAPCSTQYHLCREGGLAEHSLNVLRVALLLQKTIAPDISEETIMIVALLHDLGKSGQFGKSGYIPNMIKDGRPTKAEPEQKYKLSDSKPFKTNTDLLTIPHEIRSINIAEKFIDLTEQEHFAILHHNGMYGDLRYQLSGKETPLQILLHFADMWASRVVEREV